jgi:hypothetical protein
MDKLIRTVLSVKEVKLRNADDFVDRLSRQYTTSLLVLFAMIVSTKQFVGEAISCWCPAYFTESHRQYTNTICWVSNTYYVPFERHIPDDHELEHRQQSISYYQWVPLILLTQALMAFSPCLLWRFLSLRSGINMGALIDAGTVCQRATYVEIREKTVRYIVNQMDRYLLSQREYRQGCCVRIKEVLSKYCFLVGGKRHGNYLTFSYLIVKSLYMANAIGQLFMLDMFLGSDYHMYGLYVIAKFLRGEDWTSVNRFPRITLCRFDIRHQSRVHGYVVQCALTINLFNEKIFIIVWFWFIFLSIMTVFSMLQWVTRALYWPAQVQYIKKNLKAFETSHRHKVIMSKFAQHYLRRDGLFILRLLSMNVGEMVAAETVCGLWENYGPDRRLISENPGRSQRSGGAMTTASPPLGGQATVSMEVV